MFKRKPPTLLYTDWRGRNYYTKPQSIWMRVFDVVTLVLMWTTNIALLLVSIIILGDIL
jgi:hypothetical protein